MGEPGGLPSMGLHRVGHDWSDLAAAAAASRVETVSDFIFLGSKITADGDCSHEIKDACSLEGKLDGKLLTNSIVQHLLQPTFK